MKMMKRMRMLLLLAAALMFFMPGKVSASGWMNQKKPYQYNGVTEYLPNQDQYFDIGGNRYDEGYVFYLWNAAGTAQVLYNLKDGYTNFAFKVGHIDNTKSYTAELKIYLDGILSQTVELKPTDIAKNVSVDLTGVKHMKILMASQEALNHYDITYGIYDGVFVESGKEIVTATASNMVGNKEPYQKEGDKTEVVKKIQMAGDSFEDCLQMYLWNPASSSKIYFNFNGTYKSMSFLAGHIDNTAVINAKLEITIDGEVWDTVPLTADGLPVPVTVPLENAYQMVLSLQSDAPLNSYDIYYGIGGIQLVSDGKVTGVTLNQSSVTLTDANPSVVLKPTVVPADADVANVIWSSSDSGIVTVDQNGVIKAVSKGNAVITVQTEDGGFKAQCVVASELSQSAGRDSSPADTEDDSKPEKKPAVAIYLNKKECVVRKGDTEQFSVTVLPVDATDQITFVSSDKEIAAVSESGLLTAKRAGSATITAKAESGVSSECSVKVIQKLDGFKIIGLYDAKYTGQKITQKFSVTDGIDVLKENVDYTVSYKNNEDVGTATVTVSGTGFYEGTVSADFQITGSGAEAKQEAAPAKVKISSLRNKKSKSFTVTWKALKVKGYEVQYAQNKQFTKGKKTKTTAKSTLTVKKLKKGKKYYVRVRAYIVDSGKDKIYGAWSAVKKVKITK